jgi:dipeptidyl aminopeptidase/acylaminoacyl peptidase
LYSKLALIGGAVLAVMLPAALARGESPARGAAGPDRLTPKWEASAGSVTSELAFSPDGRLLAVGVDKVVKLLDARSGHLVRTISEPDAPRSGGVAFSPDGRMLATGRLKPPDSKGRIWSVEDGQLRRTLEGAGTVETVAFSPAGGVLATTGYGTPISLWDVATGTRLRGVGQKLNLRFCATFSPDGTLVASATARPHTIRIWRVADGQIVRTIEGFDDLINDVAFSPDGQLIGYGCIDGDAGIYRVSDGRRHSSLPTVSPKDRRAGVTSVAFSPDSAFLLTGGSALKVRSASCACGR